MDSASETRVLSLVDDFIDALINLQNAGPEEEEKAYKEAEDKLLCLSEQALQLIEGHEEYLEAMLQQLVMQKLPPNPVMDSFSGFQDDLKQMIRKSLENRAVSEHLLNPLTEPTKNPLSNGEEAEADIPPPALEEGAADGPPPAPEEDALEENAEDRLIEEPDEERVPAATLKDHLSQAFYGSTMEERKKLHNLTFDFYLPEYRLAFIDASNGGQHDFSAFDHLLFDKFDIMVIKINPERIHNVKAFRRQVKRLLIEKTDNGKRIFELFTE